MQILVWNAFRAMSCHHHIDCWWALANHLPLLQFSIFSTSMKIFKLHIVGSRLCVYVRVCIFFSCYGNKWICSVPNNAQPECNGQRKKKPNQPYKSCSRLHLKPLTSIRVDEEKWVFRAKKNVKSQTRQRQNSERLTK